MAKTAKPVAKPKPKAPEVVTDLDDAKAKTKAVFDRADADADPTPEEIAAGLQVRGY